MNFNSVMRKLDQFCTIRDNAGNYMACSRVDQSRCVRVIQNGRSAVAFPIVLESDGSERVAFHAKTIKSLIEFLKGA